MLKTSDEPIAVAARNVQLVHSRQRACSRRRHWVLDVVFQHPEGEPMTPEEFRRIGHRLVDWVADYRTRVADLPVMSRVEPGSVKAQLPPQAPERPEDWDAILGDLERVLVPGLSHWQHPRFFGY